MTRPDSPTTRPHAPGRRPRRPALRLFLTLLAAVLAATVAPAQQEPPPETFYGRSQVTAVDLVIDVRDRQGRVPADLRPEDFVVLEDGVERPVVAVETFRGGSAAGSAERGEAPRRETTAAETAWTWQTTIYVDQVLSGSGSIRRSLDTLASQAGRLTELGTVELVAANPSPEVLLPPTRSARLVEQKLLEASRRLGGRDAIRQVRRQYADLLRTVAGMNGTYSANARGEIPDSTVDLDRGATARDSVRHERLLLSAQHDRLVAWTAGRLEQGPRALLLVNDGYDLDPRDFYLAGVRPDSRLVSEIGGDGQSDSPVEQLAALTRVLAASGWVAVNLALGGDAGMGAVGADVDGKGTVGAMFGGERAVNDDAPGALPTQLVYRPLDPLHSLARETGGEVVTGRGGIPQALTRLGERVRLTYQVERPPDGKVHRVEVRSRRPGLEIKAPEWSGSPAPEAAASAKARRLLEGGAERGDLPVVAAVAVPPPAEAASEDGEAAARGTLQARIDLSGLALPETAAATSLRVTFAVSFAEGEPFVRHDLVEGQRLGGLDYWTYTVPVSVPAEAEKVSVVVEDLASGSWGGSLAARVAQLPPELSRTQTRGERREAAAAEELPEGVYDLAPELLPDRKAVVLLRPEGSLQTGRVRFDTLVTRPDVASVDFLVDGQRVESRGRAPFEARLDLGSVPRPRTVEVVARSAAGEELGRDSLVVNEGAGAFRVRLIEPRRTDAVGSVDVEADVSLRPDDELDRVEISWNDELVATLYEPPYRQRVYVPADSPVGFVAVTAYLRDGSTAEDVVFLNGPGGDERVEVNLVELYTVVTDPTGRPIRGLSEGDFRIVEEGVPQQIADLRSSEEAPLTLGLLLDSSASMAEDLARVKIAAIDFLGTTLREQDRAFLVDFDSTPRLAQPLTGDVRDLAAQAMKLRADGYTALCDALVFSLVEMQSVQGRRALVVLSDGVGREERVGFATCERVVRRLGLPIYMLVLDREGELAAGSTERRKVESLAGAAGGRVVYLQDLDRLGEVYRTIREELRSQYLLTYYPADPPEEDEFRRIAVEVLQPGLTARTAGGYYR